MKAPRRWVGLFCLALSVGCKMAASEDSPPSDGGPGGAGGAGGGAGMSGTPDAKADTNDPVSVPGVTIQEDQTGFDAIDGKVLPRQGSTGGIDGYTGTGYSDSDPGIGKTISYSLKADAAGTYQLVFRYAFGGAAENLRDGRLRVNGTVAADAVSFPYTTTWINWQETAPLDVQLAAGANFIQLEALSPSGLANIDYLKVLGFGIQPDTPSFSLTVGQNDDDAGMVSYSPKLDFYPYGTTVTVTATANTGFFFQSWTGDAPGATASYTLSVVKNTSLSARFLPDGTKQDPALVGYAAVQDDKGTAYLLNGGSLGPSVTATTVDELKMYLGSPQPYVVSFSGLLQGVDNIAIASDKTLLGVGDSAHLQGIELSVNGSRNVIIRNVTVSNVVADGSGIANDAIEITGGAKNVWIDTASFSPTFCTAKTIMTASSTSKMSRRSSPSRGRPFTITSRPASSARATSRSATR